MVLGGRLKGDKGAVLVYESENLKEWKFKHIITDVYKRQIYMYILKRRSL